MFQALVGNLARIVDDERRPNAVEPGAALGSYVLLDLLAEGGMAAVWRARHQRLGSLHAIKVPRARDLHSLARAEREATLQARLRHPNILAVTDLLDADGVPALVLDLVEGGETLETRIARGPLTPEEIETIFGQLLDAVAFAHAHGVVHRDLKPGNVLLAATGTRVADFGLARSLADDCPRLTRSGQIMGSPLYMAPEQARDAASADQRADVFSLGAILYEMVSGTAAFAAPTVPAVLRRAAAGNYTAVEIVAPGIPMRWVRAVRAALAADPEARPADVATLRSLFDGSAQARTSLPPGPAPTLCPTRRSEPSPRAERPPPRHAAGLPWGAYGAGAALVASGIGLLAWAVG